MRGKPRRGKRDANIDIGASARRHLSVRIFNVSTNDVAVGIPWKLLEFSTATVEQHYLIGANFYVEKTGEMLDRALIPHAQVNYKAHYFIAGYQKKQYAIVFFTVELPPATYLFICCVDSQLY